MLAKAHRLGSTAEEQEPSEHAVRQFEAAADAYVSATLHTADSQVVQALRMLAASHAQRAHERARWAQRAAQSLEPQAADHAPRLVGD